MHSEKFFSLRFISIIAVISLFAGSVLMFVIGALQTVAAFLNFLLLFGDNTHLPEHLTSSSVATVMLVEAVDKFLFAVVLLIFAYGIYTLFVHQLTTEEREVLPGWMSIEDVGQLKTILLQVIIVILCVNVLENVIVVGYNALTWQSLTIPFAVVCLAAALKLMQQH
jgi:uncharacterized membrane protein YqhA